MAAVVAIGGDGLARVAAARALGGRGRNQRGGEDAGGVVALLAPSSSSGSKQEVDARVLACGGHAPLPTGVR